MIRWPAIEIAPHPWAKTYARESNPQLVLKQVIQEVASGNFPTDNEAFRVLLRDTGFVSLWFYLKFICGSAGPYDKINTDLHVDMCNFRQRCLKPGIKGFVLVPRASYKSTVISHGANSWELLRDPDITIGCTSQIAERAQGFVKLTISNYTENEFHKWLYPEYGKIGRSEDEFVLSNRTKRRDQPSLRWITAGGATAGIHVDLFNPDDIVGEDLLNSDRSSGADMYRLTNWLHGNLRTLVVSWGSSRVVGAGTRYALDDPYERIMQHTREQVGYWDEVDYPVDPKGEWTTYYRPALQGQESIFPEAYSVESLDQMAETDPWLRATQYDNNPLKAGTSDFGTYNPGDCKVRWDDAREDYVIEFDDGTAIALAKCDVVAGGDPSGGGKAKGPRASKNAAAVIAHTPDGRVAIIDAQSGFVEPTRFFEWLLDFDRKYGARMRGPYVEATGGFVAVVKLLRREANERKVRPPIPIPPIGDKEATIRSTYQPLLAKGKLFIESRIRGLVLAELKVFPSIRMDLLDAIKLAIYKSRRPVDNEDSENWDDDDDDEHVSRAEREARIRDSNRSPVTGY